MSDAPYFKPHEEGPIFPDESKQLIEDAETFLRASDRDVTDELARQNLNDMSETSYKSWLSQKFEEMGIKPPESE